MSSYSLRVQKIEYFKHDDLESFLKADSTNVISKLFMFLLDRGIRSNGNPVKVANQTMMNAIGGEHERTIQYVLRDLEDLGFIELQYELERTSKTGVSARYVGKRIGIKVNLEKMSEHMNISRYDESYKTAQKRGWLRRLVNQLPARLAGFFNHEMAMAKRMNDMIKIEALKERERRYERHVKYLLKQAEKRAIRHKEKALEGVNLIEVYRMMELIGVVDLNMKAVRRFEDLIPPDTNKN